ncbi:hypothetical protein [Thalassomonas sp. M1454]|uniref:hypothetical protein n=1 Tax=Thalassomonas sp. M1454 TaxID=2594477 RepID=UPI00117F2C06|nr:hypothetical protein [Thalassomonas sp. M1454]TRX56343.1 hypothetical protein FNN08_02075 [Thalassomonas sp. M1454]
MSSIHYSHDQLFFTRLSAGISVFIVFCFALHAYKGFVDIATTPIWVHLHGFVFIAWLLLFVVQNYLILQGKLVFHRKMGRAGCFLLVLMFISGIYTTITAVSLGRVPPLFDNAYFLALGLIDITSFFCIVLFSVYQRADTHAHRRWMLVATIILMEPALGRVLPFDLLGVYFSWAQRFCQLLVIAIAVIHDIRVYNKAHSVWWWGAAIILTSHFIILFLSQSSIFINLSNSIAM